MSTRGVFFTYRDRLERPLEAGAPIQIGIVMGSGDPQGGPVIVRCEGTVVRVEPTADATGVAVSFDDFRFDMPAQAGIP